MSYDIINPDLYNNKKNPHSIEWGSVSSKDKLFFGKSLSLFFSFVFRSGNINQNSL